MHRSAEHQPGDDCLPRRISCSDKNPEGQTPEEIKLIHNQSHTLRPGLEQQDFSRQLYFFDLSQHRIILYPLMLVAELQ